MMKAAYSVVDPSSPTEGASVLKRILISLIPVIITRVMNKRNNGQQPRANKRRFNRNGR